MNHLMAEANLPAPDFRTEGMFTVTLWRPVRTVEKTPRELISDLIKLNSKVTIREMTQTTGLTRRGVEDQISQMKQNGDLKRIGSYRAGFW